MPRISKPIIYLVLLAFAAAMVFTADTRITFLRETMRMVSDSTLHVKHAVTELAPGNISGPALSNVEGWQTYRDEKYGFEFKYPASFKLEAEDFFSDKYPKRSISVEPPYNSFEDIEVSVVAGTLPSSKTNPGDICLAEEKKVGEWDRPAVRTSCGDAGYSSETYFLPLTTSIFIKVGIGTEGNRPNAQDIPRKEIQLFLDSFRRINLKTDADYASNWKIYRNEKYGFEIKYPFGFNEEGPLKLFAYPQTDVLKRIIFYSPHRDNELMEIDILSPDTVKIKGDYGWPGNYCGKLYLTGDKFDSEERIEVADYKTLHVVTEYNAQNRDYYCINNSRNPFIVSFSSIRMGVEMFPTFKFIEPTATIDTSSWKKYWNTKYGFGFSYPADHVAYSAMDQNAKTLTPAPANAEKISIAEDESKVFSGTTGILTLEVVTEDRRINDWLAQNLGRYGFDDKNIVQASTTIAGRAAVQISQPAGGQFYKLVVIKPGNYFLVATESAKSAFLDQLLATVIFIRRP